MLKNSQQGSKRDLPIITIPRYAKGFYIYPLATTHKKLKTEKNRGSTPNKETPEEHIFVVIFVLLIDREVYRGSEQACMVCTEFPTDQITVPAGLLTATHPSSACKAIAWMKCAVILWISAATQIFYLPSTLHYLLPGVVVLKVLYSIFFTYFKSDKLVYHLPKKRSISWLELRTFPSKFSMARSSLCLWCLQTLVAFVRLHWAQNLVFIPPDTTSMSIIKEGLACFDMAAAIPQLTTLNGMY